MIISQKFWNGINLINQINISNIYNSKDLNNKKDYNKYCSWKNSNKNRSNGHSILEMRNRKVD